MNSLSKDPEHKQAENIHSGFKELLTAINKPRSTYSLKSANRIYVEKTFPLLPVSEILERSGERCKKYFSF